METGQYFGTSQNKIHDKQTETDKVLYNFSNSFFKSYNKINQCYNKIKKFLLKKKKDKSIK